jgi:hypothetical protein
MTPPSIKPRTRRTRPGGPGRHDGPAFVPARGRALHLLRPDPEADSRRLRAGPHRLRAQAMAARAQPLQDVREIEAGWHAQFQAAGHDIRPQDPHRAGPPRTQHTPCGPRIKRTRQVHRRGGSRWRDAHSLKRSSSAEDDDETVDKTSLKSSPRPARAPSAPSDGAPIDLMLPVCCPPEQRHIRTQDPNTSRQPGSGAKSASTPARKVPRPSSGITDAHGQNPACPNRTPLAKPLEQQRVSIHSPSGQHLHPWRHGHLRAGVASLAMRAGLETVERLAVARRRSPCSRGYA